MPSCTPDGSRGEAVLASVGSISLIPATKTTDHPFESSLTLLRARRPQYPTPPTSYASIVSPASYPTSSPGSDLPPLRPTHALRVYSPLLPFRSTSPKSYASIVSPTQYGATL